MALARLGIMPDAFGKMGYGYFILLCRELEKEDIRHNYPACAIQATAANLGTDPEKRSKDFDPWDFMPGFRLKVVQKIATGEELSAFFGAVKYVKQ
jgi:hypothetical protein